MAFKLPFGRGGGGRRRLQQESPDQLYVGDPRFDSWEIVRDFEDLKSAQSWRQHLEEVGIPAAIVSDYPLDRFDRGDISVVVPPDRWSDAEEFLSNLDLD